MPLDTPCRSRSSERRAACPGPGAGGPVAHHPHRPALLRGEPGRHGDPGPGLAPGAPRRPGRRGPGPGRCPLGAGRPGGDGAGRHAAGAAPGRPRRRGPAPPRPLGRPPRQLGDHRQPRGPGGGAVGGGRPGGPPRHPGAPCRAAQPLAAAPGPGGLRVPGAAPRRRRLVAPGDRHRPDPRRRPRGGHPQGHLLGAAGAHRALPGRGGRLPPGAGRRPPRHRGARGPQQTGHRLQGGQAAAAGLHPAAAGARRFGPPARPRVTAAANLGSGTDAGLLRAGDGGGGGGLQRAGQPGQDDLDEPAVLRLPGDRLRGGAQGRRPLRPADLPLGGRHPRPRRPGGPPGPGVGRPRDHGGVRPQGGAASRGGVRGLQRVRGGGAGRWPAG